MKKSFTLIEVLVVVGIIGLLTSIAVASYSRMGQQSRDARRKTDLEQIRSALEMYRSNNDEY
ncbi:MAG: prepilin-type N-terminal cleavage/methylation domain-containing protein, partial [Candidatus Roizmanbacteria bacterium]